MRLTREEHRRLKHYIDGGAASSHLRVSRDMRLVQRLYDEYLDKHAALMHIALACPDPLIHRIITEFEAL